MKTAALDIGTSFKSDDSVLSRIVSYQHKGVSRRSPQLSQKSKCEFVLGDFESNTVSLVCAE
jgi:hypothetical protein